MAEIAAAAEQQQLGIDQINVAVEQMKDVTQQTAAHSEESAGAATELSHESSDMKQVVGSFRLAGRTTETCLPPVQGQSRLLPPKKAQGRASTGSSPSRLTLRAAD